MPTLPNVQSLGARPQQQTGRAIQAPRTLTIGDAEQVAAPMQIAGQAMTDYATRALAREDAVDRARLFSTYNEEAATELRRLETEADLSRPETVQQYGAFLKAKKEELLGTHRGSGDSRTALFERMENVRANYAGEIAGKSVAAQRKLTTDVLTQTLSGLASNAYDAPNSLGDLFASLDDIIDDLGPALSEEEARAYKVGGRAEIAVSAAESLLDHGALDDAEDMLASPDLAEVMPPNVMRRMRSRITVQRVNEERDRTELSRKQKQIEGFLGRSLNQSEKLSLVGLAPQARAATTADKIREFEAVMGRPASEGEIAKMYGALVNEGGTGDNMFGGGMPGRALSMITDLAPMYASSMTSPEEERMLESAMAALRMPDPITGLRVTSPPPFLADALEQRGVNAQAAFDGEQSIVGSFIDIGAPLEASDPGQTMPAPAAQAQTPDASTPDFFGSAGQMTGPVPALAEAAGRIPGIGGLVPGQEMVMKRQQVSLAQRELVRALQNNPRFAEGERAQIEREVSIAPRFMDTEQAYQARMMGIDDSLRVRLEQARRTSQNRQVSQEERAKSMDLINMIEPFLQQLNVPPLVGDEAAYNALPPGAVYRDPQGNVRTKGGSGG